MLVIGISARFLNQLIYEDEWEGKIWEYIETDLDWWALRLWISRN